MLTTYKVLPLIAADHPAKQTSKCCPFSKIQIAEGLYALDAFFSVNILHRRQREGEQEQPTENMPHYWQR